MEIKWYKDNSPIENGGIFNITVKTVEGEFIFRQKTAFKSTLTINLQDLATSCIYTEDFNGKYTCKATNTIGRKPISDESDSIDISLKGNYFGNQLV